ncbi:EamA family transporter [Tenacibaculum ovolyticum]|uniref:DMT family transporter n=1 Tax=Tenacibaculum ovolyticum TaxID=104270 RepID=UPI0022F39FE6|nr:EamA family transporter [Tenacibaculum ovolyticum]WBX74929.1 EamA family transporter [Tenacibaculum ovolyticum]
MKNKSGTGILFSFLWATAAIAMKIGVLSAEPLVLAVIRFLISGLIMITISSFILKEKTPQKKDWYQISIFGLLNISIYLGCLFTAIITVSAGLLNLFIAINPILITLFTSYFLKRKISFSEKIGFSICFIGLFIATIPTIVESKSNFWGIFLLISGMISYSLGSVYYKKIDLKLSDLTINGYQTFIGGLFLLPIAYYYKSQIILYDINFYVSLVWLIVIISIFANNIWFSLLKKDTVKASKWLFLAPVFGYFLSFFILGEEITIHAYLGIVFVILGLKISQ